MLPEPTRYIKEHPPLPRPPPTTRKNRAKPPVVTWSSTCPLPLPLISEHPRAAPFELLVEEDVDDELRPVHHPAHLLHRLVVGLGLKNDLTVGIVDDLNRRPVVALTR